MVNPCLSMFLFFQRLGLHCASASGKATKLTDAELQRQLLQLANFTGVTISNTSSKSLPRDSSHVRYKKQRRISGSCKQIQFCLCFVEEEQKLPCGEPGLACRRTISEMTVETVGTVEEDLKTALHQLESDNDLLGVFRVIRSYAESSARRKSTFCDFRDTFPDVVSFPADIHGNLIQIMHPSGIGPVMTVVWNLFIKPEAVVVPKVHLEVQISKSVRDLDEDGILQSSAKHFQIILRRLGVGKAIKSLIMAVTSTDQ
ncbi:PREDICTED: centromere protein P-like isoform X2 [Priapulus caudatus]|uniref:Centromere protein P-like isoform X2 n=1 Tax=Priapulus caudatus TaxID=37621 RepID=A0ABM1EKH2_PRICU|nr:PREDICTED: centromere protein P-like isoform X2 [Priapulus caudatus]